MAVDALFRPFACRSLRTGNRIAMASMARWASPGGDPAPLADFYRRRVEGGAGLVLTEGANPARPAAGNDPSSLKLYGPALDSWPAVIEAVHDAGGAIVPQLWHCGATSKPGSRWMPPAPFESPSGRQAPGMARGVSMDETAILETIAAFAAAAETARRLGFDGVEVHAGHGYLLDQFLRDNTNFRDDVYGGPIANRVRFMCEVMDAVIAEAGADRTGIRLSPNGDTQGCDDSQPVALFTTAAKELAARNIAFLDLREQGPDGTFGRSDVPKVSPDIRKVFPGPLVLNGDYTAEGAKAAVEGGACDGIAFGRPYISNPDLVERVKNGWPLAADNMKTWYSPGPEGYTDYPVYGAA